MTKQKHSKSTQRRVKSVTCYLKEIKDITDQGTAYVYRGQTKAIWELESGVARRIRAASPASTSSKQSAPQPIKLALERAYEQLLPDGMVQYHKNLLTEARRKGFGVVDGRELLDLELLTELQHFGAETCLLDFTESALVALYFACRNDDCENGKIFCVPHSNISTAPEDKNISALLRSGEPYQWQPIMSGEAERRIIRQDGLFFINLPPDLSDLEEIIIEADGKEEILKELKRTYQISAEKLFIDLSGFAQNHASGREWEEYWTLLYSGVAKDNSGEHEAAIADYDAAIGLKPNYAETYYNRGNAKAGHGQYEAAIADYDKAIRLKPKYTEAYNNRGNVKAFWGDLKAAIADYDEAIDLKPDLAKAYNNRGSAKGDLGQSEAAIADFDEAIRLNPDDVVAYYNRGTAKADLGQHKAAIADFDKAIALKPDYAEAYNNRGNSRDDLGQYEAAIADFDEAIRLNRDYAKAYENRGVAQARHGQIEAATADFGEAIRAQPDYANAYKNRGVAWIEQGNKKRAGADLEKALRLAKEQNLSALVAEILKAFDELNALGN